MKKNTIRLTESELKKVITESIKKVLNEGKTVNNKRIFSKGFDLAKPGDKATGVDNSEFFKSKGYKNYQDAKAAVERGELSKEIFDKWIDDLKRGLKTHNERVDKYTSSKHSLGYGTDDEVSFPSWGRVSDYHRFDDRMRDLRYDLDMKRLKKL